MFPDILWCNMLGWRQLHRLFGVEDGVLVSVQLSLATESISVLGWGLGLRLSSAGRSPFLVNVSYVNI